MFLFVVLGISKVFFLAKFSLRPVWIFCVKVVSEESLGVSVGEKLSVSEFFTSPRPPKTILTIIVHIH